MPEARLTIRGRGLLLIRFTAESNCSGGGVDDHWSVEVLVDGVQAKPNSGLDYAFVERAIAQTLVDPVGAGPTRSAPTAARAAR